MKLVYRILLISGILLGIGFLMQIIENSKTANVIMESEPEPPKVEASKIEPVRYFSESSDKIIIDVGSQTLYTDNPTTTLVYYAVDGSNKQVHFRGSDRAFVRVLGITRVFTENIEIFHPELNGVKDDTIFSGDLTILEPGTYLVKVCLGPSINLDSGGTMIWPFGCFEDQTSVQMSVVAR